MANTRSAAKQARAAVRRRALNRTQISTVRTSEKKIRALAKAGKTDEAAKLLSSRRSTGRPKRVSCIKTRLPAIRSAWRHF
jgi:ribosomal protein S20